MSSGQLDRRDGFLPLSASAPIMGYSLPFGQSRILLPKLGHYRQVSDFPGSSPNADGMSELPARAT